MAAVLWLLALAVTLALVIAAVAGTSWLRWTDTTSRGEREFGLFDSPSESSSASCDVGDVVKQTEEEIYTTFSVRAVAGLLITGLVVDVISLVAGVLYLRARAKGNERLWKLSIPAVVAALATAALVLIGCLVFVIDLTDATDGPLKPVKPPFCPTDVTGIDLSLDYGWSFYLALVGGGLACIKGIMFSIMASLC
ncbi:uncharacterized protein LOC131946343 [Physella acuta]|uniref:uncharacterized protein LOC131946343 n=1 Tax=Physella acuta TaxID=109671 RepID=UPI0027DB8245|nr:uncharacterized protein LOC131946343 [Physella acuta]